MSGIVTGNFIALNVDPSCNSIGIRAVDYNQDYGAVGYDWNDITFGCTAFASTCFQGDTVGTQRIWGSGCQNYILPALMPMVRPSMLILPCCI